MIVLATRAEGRARGLCRADEVQRGAPAIADRDEHGGDHDRRPGRRFRGGCQTDGEPGEYMPRPPPQQCETQAHQGENGNVGTADRQLECDHGCCRDEERPAHEVPSAGGRQGQAEDEQECQAEPDPRIGDRARAEQGARDPEERHHGQVRVVRVRVVDSRERRSALVGRMVMNKLASRTLDDADLRLAPAGGRVPEQRRDEGTGNADQQGEVGAP
jgi:hypothetical protein